MSPVKGSEGVLDGQTIGRLDRWRKARAVFVRPDGVEAERAVAAAFGRHWVRAPMYGRARRLIVERTPEHFLDELVQALGPLADRVRVAPEDLQQTKWDAMSRLTPLSRARGEVDALWLADELSTFRRRALQAEAKLKDIETAEGGASNIGLAQRVAELERENAALRKRLDAVTEKTKQMLDRVRFLRQQAQGSER